MAKKSRISYWFFAKNLLKEILGTGGNYCCTFEDFSMSHIFKENVQIPIPYDSYVNPTTQQVFVKFRTDRSSSKPERVVIGRAVSDTHMFPNSNFKDLFPHDWEDCCHNKGFKTKLSAGVYAATLSVMLQHYPLDGLLVYIHYCIKI